MMGVRSTVILKANSKRGTRGGFTLTELLVVIAILLILAGMTLAVFNSVTASDRIRSGARQLQSGLLGARDRSLFAQKTAVAGSTLERGIRLIVETGPQLLRPDGTPRYYDPPTNSRPVYRRFARQMVYIQQPDPIFFANAFGVAFQLRRIDLNGNGTIEASEPIQLLKEVPVDMINPSPTPAGTNPPAVADPEFRRLRTDGLITEGALIEIPVDSGVYHTIQFNHPVTNNPAADDELYLVQAFSSAGAGSGLVAFDRDDTDRMRGKIELLPRPLVGEQPIQLPAGIVIDLGADEVLYRSDLPSPGWNASRTTYDILFGARGAVSGPLGSAGRVPFLLCDSRDFDEGLNPASPTSRGDWLAVTLFTQTGFVLTSQVDRSDVLGGEDTNNNGIKNAGEDTNGNGVLDLFGVADDPFRYAKMGEAASR
jgi:prepilin-type N-terminal cleavage/methylation domain-containing protein